MQNTKLNKLHNRKNRSRERFNRLYASTQHKKRPHQDLDPDVTINKRMKKKSPLDLSSNQPMKIPRVQLEKVWRYADILLNETFSDNDNANEYFQEFADVLVFYLAKSKNPYDNPVDMKLYDITIPNPHDYDFTLPTLISSCIRRVSSKPEIALKAIALLKLCGAKVTNDDFKSVNPSFNINVARIICGFLDFAR